MSRSTQPIYEAYCKSHGRTPDEQLDHDIEEFPGGCMCGFISWVADRRQEFNRAHPEWLTGPGGSITNLSAWVQFVTRYANRVESARR